MRKRFWVWDVETLNIFTATFVDRDSDDKRVFVLTDTKNEILQLLEFLSTEVEGLIGYNSLYFDAQIIEYIYRNPLCTAKDIQLYAYKITHEENRKADVPEWKLRQRHLDLFKALSLSTSAKRVGLKWCEYMIDFENIEDIPSEGEGNNWLEMVLSYNLNDVLATKALYQKYYYEIDLRRALTEREGINLYNCTEPDLAKRLFSKYLCQMMGISKWDLQNMQTQREEVAIKDIILPYINFKTEKFQLVKQEFEKLSLKEEDDFEFVVNKDINITYGLGGIHAAPNNVVIQSDEKHVIKSLDVVSYYPNLAIKNKICAEHLPREVFLKLYEGFFNERKSIPKKDPRNYILKILLNSAYGLSNDKYSFLRDRKVTLSICINGQLLLTMLMEELLLEIPNSKLCMMNTDGFEVFIPREYENRYFEICKKWEQLTQLQLEFVDYQKMVVSDCNNYIGVYSDGKTKCKGKYEFENIPLHKNKSHAIISRAVYNYWVKETPVEETIRNHKNIFDFCAGVKAKKSEKQGQSHYELHWVENGKLTKQKLSKTVRYFISKTGKYLLKGYAASKKKKSLEHVEAPLKLGKFQKDWKVTYFNKSYQLEDFSKYDIDYSYYIYHSKKWITDIEEKTQTNLQL